LKLNVLLKLGTAFHTKCRLTVHAMGLAYLIRFRIYANFRQCEPCFEIRIRFDRSRHASSSTFVFWYTLDCVSRQ